MKSLRSENDYTHRKQTYTVEATRPDVGEDCIVTISLAGVEIHSERVKCRGGFGSGICRPVFVRWVKAKKGVK